MKKIYSFLATALMSVSVYAAKDAVPTDTDLAKYYEQGNVCMCFFVPVEINCNNIVVTGSFNGWKSTASDCIPAEGVEGFEGWYVASFAPEAEPDAGKGIQAKPIMLNGSGNFSWDYQVGAATAIRGGVQVVQSAYAGDIELINYGADAPNVFTIDAWKYNPCTAVYHDYKVTLISPDCNEVDFITPAISGGFNGWAQEAMTMNELKTAERQNANLPGAVFEISFRDAEGSEFQFRSAVEWGKDWTNGLKEYNAEEDAWNSFNGGANLVLGAETNLVYDLGDPAKYSWTNCEKPEVYDEKEFDYTITVANAPVCGEAVLSIVGGFDSCKWTLEKAVEVVDGAVALHAKNTDEFKFLDKPTGDWSNDVIGFAQTTFHKADLADGEEDGKIAVDLAGTYYALCGNAVPNVATEAVATKVIRNGQIVIVKDGVEFNVLGTQVK